MKESIRDITIYLNRDKDSNNETWLYELGQEDNDARRTFSYCGYEIGFDAYVDLDTGVVKARGIKVGPKTVKLEEEVELT